MAAMYWASVMSAKALEAARTRDRDARESSRERMGHSFELFALIDTTGGAGFFHDHFGEKRQRGLELLPYPARQVLAGGIVEARHVVEITVVQAVEYRLEGLLQVREVHDPAGPGIHRAGHVDPHLEGMAMQAGALVPLRHVRQSVGRLDVESLVDVHPGIIPWGLSLSKASYNQRISAGRPWSSRPERSGIRSSSSSWSTTTWPWPLRAWRRTRPRTDCR